MSQPSSALNLLIGELNHHRISSFSLEGDFLRCLCEDLRPVVSDVKVCICVVCVYVSRSLPGVCVHAYLPPLLECAETLVIGGCIRLPGVGFCVVCLYFSLKFLELHANRGQL